MAKLRTIGRSRLKAAGRAFRFLCLAKLNAAVGQYLVQHPDLALKDLAGRVNWSKKQLSDKLRGRSKLSIRDIGTIAAIVDCEVEFLVHPIEETTSSHPTSDERYATL